MRDDAIKTPVEWKENSAKARKARAHVADQFTEAMAESQMMGGRPEVSQRLRSVVDAERAGDEESLRAALLDAAVSMGNWAARIDLEREAAAV